MWLPNVENVTGIHHELVVLFAKDDDPIMPSGVKSLSLLESACARPLTSWGGVNKYSTVSSKLAALFHSLTKNHAFHNGNKRTALVTLLTGLHRNDLRLKGGIDDDALYDFVLSVTNDSFPIAGHGLNVDGVVSKIDHWIRSSTERTTARPRGMRTDEFIEKCRMAGAKIKDVKGGATLIGSSKASVRISKSTSQLSGPVVRRYLRRLGYSPSSAGFDMKEFDEGVTPEREQIYRFMATLRRLAKT